jgi:sec-independent protein translocase protein TatA
MFPGGIGVGEILVLMVVAVLLFGRNLPNVARTLGNSYQQFRKGLHDIQSNFRIDDHSSPPTSTNNSKRLTSYKDAESNYNSNNVTATSSAPRFDLPLETPVDVPAEAADTGSMLSSTTAERERPDSSTP